MTFSIKRDCALLGQERECVGVSTYPTTNLPTTPTTWYLSVPLQFVLSLGAEECTLYPFHQHYPHHGGPFLVVGVPNI